MKRILTLLTLVALSANANTPYEDYMDNLKPKTNEYKKIDGELKPITTDDTYYKDNSGKLHEMRSVSKEAAIDEIAELIKESHKLLNLNIEALIERTAPREELIANIHRHKDTIALLTQRLEVVRGITATVAGVYTMLIGNTLRQGVIYITSTGATLFYSPIIGTTLLVAGGAYITYGIYSLYNTLKNKDTL